MNVSTQLLDYNALATRQISVTINCGIQPTSVVTMAMKVLHNTCTMCIRQALSIHIRTHQANRYAHVHVIL